MSYKNFKNIIIAILFMTTYTGNMYSQCEFHNCDPALTGMNWNTACVEETGTAFVTVGWILGGGDTQCTTPPNSWRIQISFAQNSQYIVESAASASGPNFSYVYDEPNKTVNATLSEQTDWTASGEIVIEVTGVTSTNCDLLITGANIQIVPSFLGGCPQAFANQIANDVLSAALGVQPVVLPIELINFDGSYNEVKDVNELHWSTASEINSDYFSLERINNEGIYEEIALIKTGKNSKKTNSYTFDDKDISQSKVYYYRLNQFDLDGKNEIFPTILIKVDRGSEDSFVSFPNPTVENVTITYSGDLNRKDLSIQLFNVSGEKVSSKRMEDVTSVLDMSQLYPGVYFIKITDQSGNSVFEEKIIKI